MAAIPFNASDLFDLEDTPTPRTNWTSLFNRTLTPETSDRLDDTFDTVAKIVIIVPIVIGVTVLFCVGICVCCYCRSQRVKRENAAMAARAQEQRQQLQLQHVSLVHPRHVHMVSPNAPTYNSSLFSNGSSVNLPYAVPIPSAPSASTADRIYLASLQQQQQPHYYALECPVPAVPPRSPAVAPQPLPAPQIAAQSDEPQPWDDPVIIASKIPLDAVYTHSLVSKGGFGEVYKGSYRDRTVAIKKLLSDTRRDLKQIAAFFTEIRMMAMMEHERIIQYIGVAWDALSDVCVVTEFMAGGDLRAALTHFEEVEHRPQGFDKQKATIAWQVAHALAFMHSFRPVVLHRDLKSRNILLDETLWNAKLSDFGVSRERSDRTMTAAVGTVLWMAPEVMTSGRYDEKADVFSFGVVLSELDTHQMPYTQVKESMMSESGHPLPDTALLQRIMMGTASVSFSASVVPEIRQLGKACVDVDPDKRPTTSEVLYTLHQLVRAL